MADRLTTEQRRRCMQANKAGDTSPELRLRKALHALGLRYVLSSKLYGQPDLVFPARRAVVFVDGCFWHGCPVHFVQPATNQAAWLKKISGNRARDERVNDVLRQDGWTVIRVWEHDIKSDLARTASTTARKIRLSLVRR